MPQSIVQVSHHDHTIHNFTTTKTRLGNSECVVKHPWSFITIYLDPAHGTLFGRTGNYAISSRHVMNLKNWRHSQPLYSISHRICTRFCCVLFGLVIKSLFVEFRDMFNEIIRNGWNWPVTKHNEAPILYFLPWKVLHVFIGRYSM